MPVNEVVAFSVVVVLYKMLFAFPIWQTSPFVFKFIEYFLSFSLRLDSSSLLNLFKVIGEVFQLF